MRAKGQKKYKIKIYEIAHMAASYAGEIACLQEKPQERAAMILSAPCSSNPCATFADNDSTSV